MKPRSAKNKGWALESWVVKWLRNTKIDPQAIRTPGSGSGRFRGDIYTPNIPVIIECKNHKTPHIMEWVRQASNQTYGYQPWLVLWKPPGEPMEGSVAIIPLDLLEKLLKHISNVRT